MSDQRIADTAPAESGGMTGEASAWGLTEIADSCRASQ